MCRFLDAGNNEALGTLSCQASKKRQGTKSREVGPRLGSERYGDLKSAPTLMVGGTLPGRDGMCGQARWGACNNWSSRFDGNRALPVTALVAMPRLRTEGACPGRTRFLSA